MKRKSQKYFFQFSLSFLWLVASAVVCFAGEPDKEKVIDKYATETSNKSEVFNKRAEAANKRYLKKYFKQENKLFKKLCKKNPVLADHLFSVNSDPLFYHQNDPKALDVLKNKSTAKEYFPYKDTLQTSLSFLNKNKPDGVNEKQLEKANGEATKLDKNLTSSDKLQQYFRHRKTTMKETLTKYPDLAKSVKGYDKVNYYYHEQVAEYKKLLSDPTKVEDAASKFLKSNSAFKQFMEKNGALSMFGKIPSDWGKSIEGLQTISQTKDAMQKNVASLGANPKEIIGEKMKPMQETMGKIKSGNYGNVTNAADVPDFKPNPLKSKRLIDRLEFGTNFQVNQTNTFFPATANMGLQVAYKLTPKLSPGIGVTYMLGLGNNWNNIHFTHQGVGLRSFVDYKIGKVVFIEAGYEKNFKQEIESVEQFKEKKYWQSSALAGMKIRYSVKGRASLTFSLLYDFLWEDNNPVSQPLVYRVGYEFGK